MDLRINHREIRNLQKDLIKLLSSLRGEQFAVKSLSDYLRNALEANSDEVTTLLWEPRSILLEVVPTLLGDYTESGTDVSKKL